jgi:hypothetical protein
MLLREQEVRSADALRQLPGGRSWLAHGDVDVHHRAVERVVADGAADDPGLLVREEFVEHVKHATRSQITRWQLHASV